MDSKFPSPYEVPNYKYDNPKTIWDLDIVSVPLQGS